MDTDDTLSRWLDDAVDETAHHHALLALLAETSRVLGADLDLPTLLVKLMALAEKMVGAEASSVMLLDERRATLRWEVAEGDVTAGALRQMTLARGGRDRRYGRGDRGVDHRARRRARSPRGPPGGRRHRVPDALDRLRAHPIPRPVTGVLQVLNKRAGTFATRDREVLELIAAEAGVAIENARVYATLDERVRQRTAELTEANAQLTETLRELRQTQARLVQSEKMAALGALVAGRGARDQHAAGRHHQQRRRRAARARQARAERGRAPGRRPARAGRAAAHHRRRRASGSRRSSRI